ncbi:hypothetical protein OG599_28350 [Streptomyces sp. NBC_01335]|uniref:hypothetical protein n=1 Tax=Streptomyces sp. NBC_01335 TaxID=2903828 RepID=UPI002E119786|nr:hypothetical protein OG599_28350 [Streptomyces sp. NBC_01335]
MTYFMYDITGTPVEEPDADAVRAAVVSLGETERENPDISLTHESGWSLTAYAGGLLLWENVEDDSLVPGVIEKATTEDVLRLFGRLAAGDTDTVEAEGWRRD